MFVILIVTYNCFMIILIVLVVCLFLTSFQYFHTPSFQYAYNPALFFKVSSLLGYHVFTVQYLPVYTEVFENYVVSIRVFMIVICGKSCNILICP
jgi:hypothetical protein